MKDIDKLRYAMESSFVPGMDAATKIPQDQMHAEGDGSLSTDAQLTFHDAIFKRKLFSIETANKRLSSAPRSMWSDGHQPPPLHPTMQDHKRGRRLRYSAADMGKFAIASLELFGDLFPPGDAIWSVWCAHVR